MSRWIGTHLAASIWGGGICCQTMRRMIERWHDTGYAPGLIEITPGGHWRVREDFLRREREKKVGQTLQVVEGKSVIG